LPIFRISRKSNKIHHLSLSLFFSHYIPLSLSCSTHYREVRLHCQNNRRYSLPARPVGSSPRDKNSQYLFEYCIYLMGCPSRPDRQDNIIWTKKREKFILRVRPFSLNNSLYDLQQRKEEKQVNFKFAFTRCNKKSCAWYRKPPTFFFFFFFFVPNHAGSDSF
jgi:hypothetical protein